MSQTLDRMSTLDAEFFYAEHHNMPMHIGSVAVLDSGPPPARELMRLSETKLPRAARDRPGRPGPGRALRGLRSTAAIGPRRRWT